jgi:hypothetical protein
MNRLIHHGSCNGQFGISQSTDYLWIWHKPCKENKKKYDGRCLVTAVLLDNVGRVIFNIQCLDCHERDALKIAPERLHDTVNQQLNEEYKNLCNGAPSFRSILRRQAIEESLAERTRQLIHISPKYKNRIARHSWDEL